MEILNKKIDFAVVLSVKNANPNGDPLNGNRPRVNYDGHGELSDVCIKRKIRNRLLDEGKPIFVQSDDHRVDDYRSLHSRAKGTIKDTDMKDKKKYREAACKEWLDVRAFGQVFAYGKKSEEEASGVSIGIRGPVSIHPAFSVAPVAERVTSIQITKSVNNEEGEKKGPDTMGMKHRVDHGVYVFYGCMNPQLAETTGFSNEDAEAIKKAITTLFRGDASSARPEGSMEVKRIYWWKHQNKTGQYSSAKVHRAVGDRIQIKEGISEPQSIEDYIIPNKEEIEAALPGLACEVFEGE